VLPRATQKKLELPPLPPEPPKPAKKNRIFDIGHDPRVFRWEQKPAKSDDDGIPQVSRRRQSQRFAVLGDLPELPDTIEEEDDELEQEEEVSRAVTPAGRRPTRPGKQKPKTPTRKGRSDAVVADDTDDIMSEPAVALPEVSPSTVVQTAPVTPEPQKEPEKPSWQAVIEADPDEALAIALEEPAKPIELPKSEHCIGIDFGTCGCRFAIFGANGLDSRISPSQVATTVAFIGDEKKVGSDVALLPPEVTVVQSCKRLIGHEFTSGMDYEGLYGCEISQGATNLPVIAGQYSPEQIIAFILGSVKAQLAEQLQEDVVDAVIAVPAFFSNSQRQATLDAASIAGFNVMRLQSETVAALMARPFDSVDRYLVVIDFGGGKLDLSLVQQAGATLTILRTAGDTQFGGIDLDKAVADVISREMPVGVSKRQILTECRRVRELLAFKNEATISLNDFSRVITKAELNGILESLYAKVTQGLQDLFENNRITKDRVKEVHLVGGLRHVPDLANLIKAFFVDPVSITTASDNAIVVGAAMEGAIRKQVSSNKLPRFQVKLTTPLSLGLSLADGTCLVLIPRGTVLPATKSTTTTTSRDDQRNVGFDVVEGERKMAKDNVRLGSVVVDGIQQALRGVPRIEVTMEINEDGILVVTAVDLRTGALITATIESGSNLSKHDIIAMMAEAEAYKLEDNRVHKRTQWRTRLHSYVDSLLQKDIPDDDQRTLIAEKVAAWKHWNATHQNELVADVYIKQYFEVRKVIKQILG
jgi:molecular chaperone DnaK (HSP70)